MKAIRVHEYGDESVLKYEEVAEPTIGPDGVLIRVRAASINRGDLSRRSGTNSTAPLSEPLIIGWDVAGDVLEVGSEVENVRVGQRVVVRLPSGGYAELAAANGANAVPLPDGMDYDQAATTSTSSATISEASTRRRLQWSCSEIASNRRKSCLAAACCSGTSWLYRSSAFLVRAPRTPPISR